MAGMAQPAVPISGDMSDLPCAIRVTFDEPQLKGPQRTTNIRATAREQP